MNVAAIRAQFPVLRDGFKGTVPIYLDSACMTLRPTEVIEEIMAYYQEYPVCGARSLHRMARHVTLACEEAREMVAAYLGCEADEVIWTRNASEGLNLALQGFGIPDGGTVLMTDKEHNSVLVPAQRLAQRAGGKVVCQLTDEEGKVEIQAFCEALTSADLLITHETSNLDGVRMPIGELAQAARDADVPLIVDGAQTMAAGPVDVRRLGIDAMAFSSHKAYGPGGLGILYLSHEIQDRIEGLSVGGETIEAVTHQEHILREGPERFEAGLQNFAAILGARGMIRFLESLDWEVVHDQEARLNARATEIIWSMPGTRILGPSDPAQRTSITSFMMDRLDHHDLALMLDETAAIAIRSGMHCVNAWFASRGLPGSCRISLGVYNTMEELEVLAEAMAPVASHFE